MDWFPISSSSSAIQLKYSNWKAFLVKRLTGAKTLPADFAIKVRNKLSLLQYIAEQYAQQIIVIILTDVAIWFTISDHSCITIFTDILKSCDIS